MIVANRQALMVHNASKRFLVWFLLAVPTGLYADEFPKLYNSEPAVEAKPMPAQEAARAFQLPPGIVANVFAAEPDVQNPIAMAWDSQGRVWIAENYTYAERSQRFDLKLRDRVIVLSDTNGDGVHDHRSVFSDQVQMLTGIEVGHGGVWLMCPPLLLRIPDQDFDGVADGPAEVLLDGFDVAAENYHNFANGLRWGPDGWLYGRCGGSCPGMVGPPGSPENQRTPLEGGIWRYHVQQKRFEVLCHGTTNPWGHDWNQWGECFFINTVNGHLWHMIPGAHFHRPFTLDPNPHVYELIDMHADHWHFDTKGEWFLSRAGAANDFGGGHAHVGMMIYLGNQWPSEYQGRLFTWNMHGQRANQEILKRLGSGYVAEHGRDTMLAKDPFFRGMDLSYGPEGSVFGIDWSDTGECHEHTGVHRTSGRVYRFSAQETAAQQPFSLTERDSIAQADSLAPDRQAITGANAPIRDLRKRSSLELAELHKHSNEWYIRQARLILSERALSPRPFPETRGAERHSNDLQEAIDWLSERLAGFEDQPAYNALMTLFAMDRLQDSQLQFALQHRNEHLRTWAVRLIVDQLPIDNVLSQREWDRPLAADWFEQFLTMAQNDSSGMVRLALASALQRLPLNPRLELAAALMSRSEDAEDHNLPLLVWYGLIPVAESMPVALADVALASSWPKTQRLIARRLSGHVDRHPEALNRLMQGCRVSKAEQQWNLLQGMAQGLKGWRAAPAPTEWPVLLQHLQSNLSPADDQREQLMAVTRELALLFGDGRSLAEVQAIVCDLSADISLRRTALEALVANSPDGIEDICLPLLEDARLNGIALQGLARSAKAEVATALIKNYTRFRSPERPAVIAVLASRVHWAEALLKAVADGKIPKDHLTAYDVRQMLTLGSQPLIKRIDEQWGIARTSNNEKKQRIEELKKELMNKEGLSVNLGNGRLLFERQCALCHRLYGSGQAVGPDLTGGNRRDLDYLLENIIDPSAVVSKNFHMSIVLLNDGRTLSGLVVSRAESSLELLTQTALFTLPISEIEEVRATDHSPMPDGLLDSLSDQEIFDLLAYLQHPTQVPLPEK